MKYKKLFVFFLAIIIFTFSISDYPLYAATTTTSTGLSASDQATLDALQAKLKNTEDTLNKLKSEQSKNQKNQKNTKATMANLTAQINTAESQIDTLNDKIQSNQDVIDKLDANITLLKGNISQNLAIFKQRVRAMYMSGNSTEIELLLSSGNYVDMLTRIEVLHRISEYDNSLINKLLNDKKSLETQQAQVQKQKNQLISDQNNLKNTSLYLSELYQQNATTLSSLQTAAQSNSAALQQAQSEEAAQAAEINAFVQSHKSTLVYDGKGFAWPLPGFSLITSPYGPRDSGFHTGMDISGAGVYGMPIVAAADGQVILVGDRGSTSYGKYLIIDHGSGNKTLYAHTSKILVKQGDIVKKGQHIANVGSTGHSTGPHLHFEVWINNVRVNPATVVTYGMN